MPFDYYAPGNLPKPTYEVVKTDEQGIGYVGPMTLFYCYYYIDHAGINGPERFMRIAIPEGQHVVVLAGMPSGYSDAMSHVELWVNASVPGPLFQSKWKWVGKVEHDTLGVFVDKGIYETKHKPIYRPNRQEYRGGVRWSEPYQPDFIKYDSFIEVRSGDGKHITGLDKIYGNLIIFKEDSIHRTTLQNADPPLSRWDEVTAEYGCIAPNTLINVDNTLYFLSWKGLCKYDNNQLTKIDGKFAEELQYIIQTNKDNIRDASCGYNPYYNELYLNVPIKFDQDYTSEVIEMIPNPDFAENPFEPEFIQQTRTVIDYTKLKRIYEKENIFFDERRFVFSHIYVVKLDIGIAYKFGYQPILAAPGDEDFNYIKNVDRSNGLVRLYYNNSLGEMRSADILASQYADRIWHAGIYIETPYEIAGKSFKDTDSILDSYYYATDPSDDDMYRNRFPAVFEMAIRSAYKSKYFTGEDETQIKRLREIVMNLYSKGIIVIDLRYFNYDSIDNRINEINQLPQAFGPAAKIDRYMFNPTISRPSGIYAENQAASAITGTNNNILHIIPNSNFEESLENLKKIFDINGKPVKFAVDIFTEYRTQLNELSYYWRPIHGYLS